MRGIFYLLLTLSGILVCGSVSSQTVYMKHYTIKDGLPGNHVYMCHSDNEGYIWIATTSGLSRYDGRKFRNYDYEDGLQDNEVLFVSHDADNNIWASTFSATPYVTLIQKNHPRSQEAHSKLSIPTKYIYLANEYYSATNKITYFNGYNYMVCIKPGVRPFVQEVPVSTNSAFFETEDGKIFSGDTVSLYSIEDTAVSFFQSLSPGEPFTRLAYFKGTLYAVVGSHIKAYSYSVSGFRFVRSYNLSDNISYIAVDNYGIWVSFINKKDVHLYRKGELTSGYSRIRIPGYINHLTQDKEGGIWISTTDNGVFFIPDPDMISYTYDDGLASSVITAASPSPDGRLWLGYNTGVAEQVSISHNNISVHRKIVMPNNKDGTGAVLDIVHDKLGNTYFLSNNCLLQVNQTRQQKVPTFGSNKSVLPVNDTFLSVGDWSYEVVNPVSMMPKHYNLGRIYAQSLDLENLWLGGLKGLYCFSIRDNKVLRQPVGLKNTRINAISVHDAYLWAGTQNSGIYLIRNDSVIRRFTIRNTKGLPSNTIKAFVIKDNELWIGTNRGVLYTTFNYDSLKFTGTQVIDYNDGLLSPEVNDMRLSDSGIIIATYGGVTVMKGPQHKSLNYTISDIIVREPGNNKSQQADSVVVLYDQKGLEISFHAISFKYSGEITYSYQLQPFDNEWKQTRNNIVQYTNIPPGDYQFYIKAGDNHGNSGIVQAVFIHVKPLFWQTTWFKCIVALVIVLLVVAVLLSYYYYSKRQTNKKLQQGRLIAKARLEALKAQIKPHFIFNSLNAIKDYIYNNKNDDAAELLQGFSNLVRKGLNLADVDFINIEQEVNFLKQYLDLEQLKCDYCFDYHIDMPEKITNIVIPSLITQPFVENAVIHGMRSVKNSRAALHITYMLSGDDVICTIMDNGIGIKRSMQHKKTHRSRGTDITKDRIIYFQQGLGIDISLEVRDRSETNEATTGTIVVITIKNATKFISHENHH